MSYSEEIKKNILDNFGSIQYSIGDVSITLKKGSGSPPSITILDGGHGVLLRDRSQVENTIKILQKLIKNM